MPIKGSDLTETNRAMVQQPNIVLFMTDQLRRDALGCYGNRICQTPNLDQLAEQGTCFENAFTISPVCSPSRASLMTGLYPHNNGVMINTHIAPVWNRGLSTDMQTHLIPKINSMTCKRIPRNSRTWLTIWNT